MILAIYWQIFSGISSDEHQLAVPVFHTDAPPDGCLVLPRVGDAPALREDRLGCLAGVTGGLGVFFETETGIYLLATFFIYSVLRAGLAPDQGRPTGRKDCWLPALVFCVCVGAVLFPLLLYASRGTLFTGAFWRGWVEALVMFGASGVGALPIAELPEVPLMLFLAVVALYLGVFAYAALRGLHGQASGGDILLAALSAYGLAVLLLFVGRSHPYNLAMPRSPAPWSSPPWRFREKSAWPAAECAPPCLALSQRPGAAVVDQTAIRVVSEPG